VPNNPICRRVRRVPRRAFRTKFYRWYNRYLQRGEAGLQNQYLKPKHVWNRGPDEVRRRVVDLAFEETERSLRESTAILTDRKSHFGSLT
jgi:putative transposase